MSPNKVGIVRQIWGTVRQWRAPEWLGWTVVVGGMSYTAALESRRAGKAKDSVTFCQGLPIDDDDARDFFPCYNNNFVSSRQPKEDANT